MKHILCVDDEEFICKMIQFNLKKEGYKSTSCNNGYEALELAKENSFDLAILDIMMPQMNGFKLITKLKELYPTLPVIFLTAKRTEGSLVTGFELGAEEFLTKPFKLAELNIKIKRIFERQPIFD